MADTTVLDQLKGLLKTELFDAVKGDAEQFLKDNLDAAKFLEEQAKDLAQLGLDYVKADADGREKILFSMKIVQQTIQNKLAAIAVDAEATARAEFKAKLGTLTDILIKAVPIIMSAV